MINSSVHRKFNIVLMSFSLLGCGIYSPTVVDIPLLEKKGDLRIDGGISLNPSIVGTISYGLTNAVSLQSAGKYTPDGYHAQFATGYFKKLEKNIVLEIYGGVAFGKGEDYKDQNPGTLYDTYTIYFTQFNVGKNNTDSDNLEYGLGL